MGAVESSPSLWALLGRLPMLRWVAIQMAVAGVLAALARAPRLGRPRPDPDSGADRPAAHAEALGALLEKVRADPESHELLERYRTWRSPRTPREPTRHFGRARAPSPHGAVTAAALHPEPAEIDRAIAAGTQADPFAHATTSNPSDANATSKTAPGI